MLNALSEVNNYSFHLFLFKLKTIWGLWNLFSWLSNFSSQKININLLACSYAHMLFLCIWNVNFISFYSETIFLFTTNILWNIFLNEYLSKSYNFVKYLITWTSLVSISSPCSIICMMNVMVRSKEMESSEDVDWCCGQEPIFDANGWIWSTLRISPP